MKITDIVTEAANSAQQAAKAIAMKKAGKKPRSVDEDLTRRGFLRGLGAAAVAGAAGSALAGTDDLDFPNKVQKMHSDMMEKNPRYAKEHEALGIALARGFVGAAAENNKRWYQKTAELLQKYGVKVNEGVAEGSTDQYKAAFQAIQKLQSFAQDNPDFDLNQLDNLPSRGNPVKPMFVNADHAIDSIIQAYITKKEPGNAEFLKQLKNEINYFLSDRTASSDPTTLGDLLQGKLGKINFQQGVAEATGDEKFDKMMTTIKQGTNKQKTADRKEQKKQTQQRARDAFGNMFGGGNPADKLSIRKDVSEELAEEFDLIESIVEMIAEHNGVDAETVWEDLESLTEDELYVFAVTSDPLMEDWQKANKRDKTDGMSQKAVNAYRRENPGSKLKTAVTTKPGKLKKGGKASKRRKSYCSRSRGQMKMHSISCAKTPDKAICKARRRWNC